MAMSQVLHRINSRQCRTESVHPYNRTKSAHLHNRRCTWSYRADMRMSAFASTCSMAHTVSRHASSLGKTSRKHTVKSALHCASNSQC